MLIEDCEVKDEVVLAIGESSVLRQLDYRGPLPLNRVDAYTKRICERLVMHGMVQVKHDLFCLTRRGLAYLDEDGPSKLKRAS